MKKIIARHSIEYCGKRYFLVERIKNNILYEDTSYKSISEYVKKNNILLCNEV